MNGFSFPSGDILALCFFLGGWICYSRFADVAIGRSANLMSVMNRYRLNWMQQMLKRDNRMIDAAMMGNLLRSISFFANTSIFILFGLITLFSYREKASQIIDTLPFATPSTPFMWEVKIFLLAIIFIYAFFKYTWSLRQYNYACAYVAAAPMYNEQMERHKSYAEKGAHLINNAARHFNMGLRAYYFGLAALSWFVNGFMLAAATTLVICVVYRREFRSHTLNNLAEE